MPSPTEVDREHLRRVTERLAEVERRAEELSREVEEGRRAEAARRAGEGQRLHAQKLEAVGRLAGGIAHDFNNLLTVVNGYTDMLLASLSEGDGRRTLVEEIRSAGQRSAALTRQLMAFSRKQILHPEGVDLNALVERMAALLRRLAGEHVEVILRLDAAAPWVRVDPGQIEQVLVNLALNARDAMPDGGELLIETSGLVPAEERPGAPPPGSHALLAVSDTGCGMDEETKSHLFEPFFTTKGPDRGTGLGLATVHGIVQQSGGQVAIASELGRGTRCSILLPRVAGAVEAHPRDRAAETPRGDETVLLVEDEHAVRRLARRVLEMQGYTVLEAARPEEADVLSAGHVGAIDLLLTDVVMPAESGRKLADRLVASRPGMRVLFMSGYTDDAIVRHGVLEAGTEFLQKPFTPQALARRVREVLDG